MTSIERTAYPRFKRYYTEKELREIYTPTSPEKVFSWSHTTGLQNYLNLIILLKTFQRLGYFPQLKNVPLTLINYLKNILNLSEKIKVGYEHQRTEYRHRSLIRERLQVKPFNQDAKEEMNLIIKQSATIMDNPADIINVAIEELVKERYELPSFNTLDREVSQIREQVNNQIFERVLTQLSADFQLRLNELLESNSAEKRSQFNQLKQLPKKPTRNHINDLLAYYYWLESLGEFASYLKHISQPKLKHFAAEAKALDASALKEMSLPKRLTLLLCLIYWCQGLTRDNLIEMFLKRMAIIHKKGKDELARLQKLHQEKTEKLVGVFANVLQVLVSENKENQLVNNNPQNPSDNLLNKVNEILIPSGGIEQLLNECEAVNAPKWK